MSHNTTFAMSRRGFLKNMSIASLAFSPLVYANRAMANTGVKPRLLIIGLAHGIGGKDCATGTETNFTLKPWLSPLNAVKQHVTVIDGLFGTWWGNQHSVSFGHLLTGNNDPSAKSKFGKGSAPRNASIDVMLDKALGQGVLPAQQLIASVRTQAATANKAICFNERNQPLPMLGALDANKLLLNNLAGVKPTPGKANGLVSKRKHILDELNKDISSLRSRIGASERNKLDQHLDAIKNSASSLGLNAPSTGLAGTCIKPTAIGQPGQMTDHEFYLTQQLKHIKTLFSCNLTNTATLWVPDMPGSLPYPWVDSKGKNRTGSAKCSNGGFHACVAHYVNDADLRLCYEGSVRWFMTKVAAFAQELDKIKESNGRTMLENTMIVLTGEVGSGMHEVSNKPYVVIGGRGAPKLRTGRYLKQATRSLTNGAKVAWQTSDGPQGDPRYFWKRQVSVHSELDFWLEISEAMGVNGGVKNFGASYPVSYTH
jgi:hypothetical protein